MTATIQTLLLLIAVLVVVAVVARRFNTAPSILLVIAGIGLALIPGLPRIELAPLQGHRSRHRHPQPHTGHADALGSRSDTLWRADVRLPCCMKRRIKFLGGARLYRFSAAPLSHGTSRPTKTCHSDKC